MRPLPQDQRFSSWVPARGKFPVAMLVVVFVLAVGAGMLGCGGGGASSATPPSLPTPPLPAVGITLTPPAAEAVLGNTLTFVATVTNSNDTNVSWSVNGVRGGNATIGTISAVGVYPAPADLPSPATAQITATSHADASKFASASLTIVSDIAISLSPTTTTVELGAAQIFQPSITSSGHPDTAVRWSVSGAGCATSCGSVDASGRFTAPQILPSPATLTVTAQSLADPSRHASGAVAITSNFSLALSAPGNITTGGTATIAAMLTPVAGSNPTSGVSWTVAGAASRGAACGAVPAVTP